MLEMKVAKTVREQREARKELEQADVATKRNDISTGYPESYTKGSYTIDSGPSNPFERLDDDLARW